MSRPRWKTGPSSPYAAPRLAAWGDAAGVPTDQFQPLVAAGPAGAVAVAFYDRRLPCPRDLNVLRGSAVVRGGRGLLYIAQWHPGIKTGRER